MLIKALTKKFARKLKSQITPQIFQKQIKEGTPEILLKNKNEQPQIEEEENFQNFKKKNPDEFKLMKTRIHGDDMPRDLQNILKKILSKYKRKDVYEKGKDYMHLKSLLNSREGPMDLNEIKVY